MFISVTYAHAQMLQAVGEDLTTVLFLSLKYLVSNELSQQNKKMSKIVF